MDTGEAEQCVQEQALLIILILGQPTPVSWFIISHIYYLNEREMCETKEESVFPTNKDICDWKLGYNKDMFQFALHNNNNKKSISWNSDPISCCQEDIKYQKYHQKKKKSLLVASASVKVPDHTKKRNLFQKIL